MITRTLNETTYHIKHHPTKDRVVIGDAKQDNFYPRVKHEAFDNECNYSFGIKHEGGSHSKDGDVITYDGGDIRAKFYTKRAEQRKSPTNLRWLNMGELDPYEAAAEYELQRSLGHYEFSVATYRVSEPSIMVFGLLSGKRYLDIGQDCKATRFTNKYGGGRNDRLPVVRVPLANTNPYFMDQNLVNIDIHLGHHYIPNVKELWVQAVMEGLELHGIKSYRKKSPTHGALKVYVRHGEKDVKVHSADLSFDILSAYLNFDCDYNRVYDYYSPDAWPDVSSDIRDTHAYGLKSIYKKADYSIVNDIIRIFAKKCGVSLDERKYNKNELARLRRLTEVHKNYEWVENAKRNDPGWHYETKQDGYEFDIILQNKPASNVIELSMRHKNVAFYYQPPLAQEELDSGHVRWSHVEGSWAVYHADHEKVSAENGNKYQCAKVGHIYRPWAQDAKGMRVWCDLHIDADNNEATITLPNEFYKSAEYPVTIDPVMGYTKEGATGQSLTQEVVSIANDASLPYTGTIQSVTAYADINSNNSPTLRASYGVYNQGWLTKLDETGNFIVNNMIGAGWYTFATTTNPSLSAYTIYRPVIWVENPGDYESFTVFYDSYSISFGRSEAISYSDPLPASITLPTSYNRAYSVYINISAGGETPRQMGKGSQHAW